MREDQPAPMANKRCIPSRRMFTVVCASIVVYVLIAEVVGLYPMGQRHSKAFAVSARLFESLTLWFLSWLAIGSLLAKRWRGLSFRVRTWPIVLPPLAFGLGMAISFAWEFQGWLSDPVLPSWVPFAASGVNLFGGVYFAACLYFLCHMWAKWGAMNICPICRYDLTGNVSGTCPECGSPVESDTRIPVRFYAAKYRWFPELGDFNTPKERYEALQRAWKDRPRTVIAVWAALTLPVFIPAILWYETPRRWLGSYWRWVFVASLILASIALGGMYWVQRGMIRKSLRKQLSQRDGEADRE